jgi:hypothetical protein
LGHTWSTSNASLLLLEANGSYTFSAFAPVAHDPAYPDSGYDNDSFVVAGHAVFVELWGAPPAAVAGSASTRTLGSISPTGFLAGGLAVVLLVGIVVAVLVRRRGPAPLPSRTAAEARTPHPPVGAAGAPASETESPDPLRHML